MRHYKLLWLSALLLPCFASSKLKPENNFLHALSWVPSPITAQNLCGGHFATPTIVENTPHPKQIKAEQTRLSAKGSVSYNAKKNVSTLHKQVVVKQPGRLLKSSLAYLYRNPKTHKLVRIVLKGHVHLFEYHRHILGHDAYINLNTHTLLMHHVSYHIYANHGLQGQSPINAWGKAAIAHHSSNGVLRLSHASYTTCSPVNPAWLLHAKSIRINKTSGWGSAKDAWLSFKGIPFLYFPYYTFPINHNRKTGFLTPNIGHSSRNGLSLTLPFYLNLAPNYDDTLTSVIYSKRGILFKNNFRVLSQHSITSLNIDGIFDDHGFKRFKRFVKQNFPSSDQPYQSQLANASDNRFFIHMDNQINWNKWWKSALTLNLVSDPYYFQDFNQIGSSTLNQNQLLNQFSLHYSGIHWQFLTRLSGYDTLHPVNTGATLNQYRRLPEIDINADYPDLFAGTDFSLNTQFTRFTYQSIFAPRRLPVGTRVHLSPTLSKTYSWSGAYITPSVSVSQTNYETTEANSQHTNKALSLPIVNIDSGLYLQRLFKLGKTQYLQTLSPRVFYLYVPYKQQSFLPNYDTNLLPFSYAQIFSKNAFTGFDRIQNANQLSAGVSSSVFNSTTGAKLLSAGIGIIDYFATPKVCLSAGCTPNKNHYSPLAAQLNYYPTAYWTNSLSAAFNVNSKTLNNAGLSMTFDANNQHLFNIGYSYIKGTAGNANASLLTTGFSWPLGIHWQTLGYGYYNVSQHYPQQALIGLSYKSCGYAIRLIADRRYIGDTYNNGVPAGKQYDNTFYVQLNLDGLGSIGNSATTALDNIPGYHDPFSNHPEN